MLGTVTVEEGSGGGSADLNITCVLVEEKVPVVEEKVPVVEEKVPVVEEVRVF